jgi:hypothetical protein
MKKKKKKKKRKKKKKKKEKKKKKKKKNKRPKHSDSVPVCYITFKVSCTSCQVDIDWRPCISTSSYL